MSHVLASKYERYLSQPCLVQISGGWLEPASTAIEALTALHPDIRIGALYKDQHGMMCIDVGVVPLDGGGIHDQIRDVVEFDTALLDRMQEVTAKARLLSAWTCYEDGKPGWLVDAPEGRRPLCPECQARRGMKVRRHAA
ncbi:hypothetical protein MUO32_26205 [Shinella sp. CPCC 101442]|uniref:hypothetical protein n=1 Tax=Shinella sp. CPCC 101442 TaxID=2932265 RepID=UPI002153407B|nr:hypothetical protein [Shinella sp. CPCC 101442]MCR6502525.1 hypothetical protein [Shinella sp. CPCC 101442]